MPNETTGNAVEIDQLSMSEFIKQRENPSAAAEKQATTSAPDTETNKPATANAVTTAPASGTGTTEIEEEGEEGKKSKGGFQRKIDKLTKRISERDEALADERLARQRLEAQLAGKTAVDEKPKTAVAGDDDPEPKEEDFAEFKEFNKALSRWAARQETKTVTAKNTEAEQKKAFEAEEGRLMNEHAKRIDALKASGKHEDLDEVLENLKDSDMTIPPAVGRALIELENSADVVYHLAKNPDVVEKLNGMSVYKALQELGRIADKLMPAEVEAKPETPVKEKPQSPPVKPVTAAPAPIKPVGSSTTRSAPDPDKMSMSEYNRMRDEQQGVRR